LHYLLNRREEAIVKRCAALALLIVTLAAMLRPARADTKPNILFILADDMDYAVLDFMPNVKALLIDQGASFDHFFANVALSGPSRATILSGQYSHNHGVTLDKPVTAAFGKAYTSQLEQHMIPLAMKMAGYETSYIGKYINGYPGGAGLTYTPPGWDNWASPVRGNAYVEYSYTLLHNGKMEVHGKTDADYGTDVYTTLAIDAMKKAASESKPFFVYLGVYAPHEPAFAAKRHLDLFADATAPHNPSFDEADVNDKPKYIQSLARLTARSQRQIDALYRKRLQSLQALDEDIAKLIDVLKTNGQLDNTYIFFSSGNGFHLGNHRMTIGKEAPYDEDIRIPLVVRGPGVTAKLTLTYLAGTVDLAPTFADIAGTTADRSVDGRSLRRLWSDEPPHPQDWRQAYLIEHWTASKLSRGVPEFAGLRTADYTYVEYATGEIELYDLHSDPNELDNFATKADPALLKTLAERLAEIRKCAGENCRAAESMPITP
jgi:N-acetylglucosamine-6-sulfatase